MFEPFWGNEHVTRALMRMIESQRIPQSLLFEGPEGVGKATLARRVGAELLGHKGKIEQDDLNLEHNLDIISSREKWPAEKRNEDPLLFASHPDFVTFAPDGPLRQISIPQMRLLKEQAQFKPSRGNRRIFLIDHIDRAGEQAANSLLKTLEEPPGHLILILTAENAYDLLPTIRSRVVPLHFNPLSIEEMNAFMTTRDMDQKEKRIGLSMGSPGLAISLDLELYEMRRAAMLVLLQVAAGAKPFSDWIRQSEALSRSKAEKLELYLKVLYVLLRDVLILHEGGQDLRNIDLRPKLQPLAAQVSFNWIRTAVKKIDELIELLRRNIQKTIALDSLILELQSLSLAS